MMGAKQDTNSPVCAQSLTIATCGVTDALQGCPTLWHLWATLKETSCRGLHIKCTKTYNHKKPHALSKFSFMLSRRLVTPALGSINCIESLFSLVSIILLSEQSNNGITKGRTFSSSCLWDFRQLPGQICKLELLQTVLPEGLPLPLLAQRQLKSSCMKQPEALLFPELPA